MGILRRIVSMTKAAANEMLDKMENPAMMMNQYLRDLEEQIAQAEQAVVEQQTQERILQAKLDDNNVQIAHYEEKAEQAALEGRERDARAALEAKLLYQEQYDQNVKLQQMAAQAIVELKQRIEAMKEEQAQLQNKRSELMTRLQQTGGSKGYPFASNLQANSATQGFNRIEQKIMEWEAQQEVYASNYGYKTPTTGYAEQQQELRNAYVDEELQRLMQKQSSKSSEQS
ncbi:protein LiaH [Paenibacillus montaniterrae]|uniref:Protein LiaH n=1 Tax=Paenibacillus montaniterrae TaxID=429341 RepID=A0A920CVU2_9BACL|nr:PspA/IM30 family protein [Paenibacillus montaniterrae]GIP18547.1 protein LiaH [Paenibacillus montaniterrae]